LKNDKGHDWQDIVIFCRTDYCFNTGHITHIENQLIRQFEDAKSEIQLTNSQYNRKSPEATRIAEEQGKNAHKFKLNYADKDIADDFVYSIRILARMLMGFDMFASSTETANVTTEKNVGIPYFYLATKEKVLAVGYPVDGDFVVVKGSKIKQETAKSYLPIYLQMREKLLEDGSIDKEKYEFTKDVSFKAISAAASVVAGSTQNGNAAWKKSPDDNKPPFDIELPKYGEKRTTFGEWLSVQPPNK
jgi:hypothetical protein